MAINYTYFESSGYRVIKTHVSNIVSEVIKKPVCSTNNYGINGGHQIYILRLQLVVSQSVQDPGSNAGGTRKRGTFFTYLDNGVTKAGITRCTTIPNLKQQVGNLQFKTIIGGGSLHQLEQKTSLRPSTKMKCGTYTLCPS